MRRLSLLLPLLVLLTLAGAPSAHAAQPGVTPLGNYYEGAHQVDELSAVTGALSKAPAEGKWARLFVDWGPLEPTQGDFNQYELGLLSGRIDAYRAAGVRVALVVSRPPGWAAPVSSLAGARQYADFMARLAARLPSVAVWELLNEPNLTDGFDPASYAQLLRVTYPAVKAASPLSTVILGGLAGNDYNFLQGIYDAGGGGSFDGVGVHTDTACLTNGPGDVAYRDAATGRVGWTVFTAYREVHQVMADHGDGAKGIYMTEMGWSESVGKHFKVRCDQGAGKGKKAGGVTRPTQTANLKAAFACLAADPYVVMASWFTDQDHIDPRKHVSGYGLYDFDGHRRPIYGALQDVGDGTGAGVDRSCGGKVDRDPPTVTIKAGPTWFGRLVVSGAAADPTTGVQRIELWGDGKKVIKARAADVRRSKGHFRYDWFGSSRLPYGKHTVELRAYDAAGNVGKASTEVERLDPRTAARTVKSALKLRATRRGSRSIVVRASVRTPRDGSFREKPHGRLELRFERRYKGHWQRSRVRKGIGSGRVAYTYTAKHPGRWRAYAVLDVDAPYRKTRTKPFGFRLR